MPAHTRRPAVDLEAIKCLGGHHWNTSAEGVVATGPLRGVPVRVDHCAQCTSKRITALLRDPYHRYDLDPAYIGNARALEPDPHLRRRAYREAIAERAKASGLLIDPLTGEVAEPSTVTPIRRNRRRSA